jgi:hypothetical protein
VRVYFSHGYRETTINAYFLRQLIRVLEPEHERQNFELAADQKSPTWCLAKLERNLSELSGFISIVSQRESKDGQITFSPFINSELNLGRRFGLPRLVFVDDKVLSKYPGHFPEDAMPFAQEALDSDAFIHRDALDKFRRIIVDSGPVRRRRFTPRSAAVVSTSGREIVKATSIVIEMLKMEGYHPQSVKIRNSNDILDDAHFIELVVGKEICIFLLDQKAGLTDVALATAHARCVPSIRLQYQPQINIFDPHPSGRVPWSNPDNLASVFLEQLTRFRTGLVETVSLARETTAEDALRQLGTTEWEPTSEHLWDPHDGPGLIKHVKPGHILIRDMVSRVRNALKSGLVSIESYEICLHLYSEVRRQRFAYELEQKSLAEGKQAIRTVSDVFRVKAATCLDMACIFASLLVCGNLTAVMLILDCATYSHALVGYQAPSGVLWDGNPDIGKIRGAISLDDLIVFEPTGAVESERRVAGETDEDRRVGGKMLDFTTSTEVAKKLIMSPDTKLRLAVIVSTP